MHARIARDASAPGRVNLIGEHTDYNGGLCLPLALPQRTTVTVTRRDDLVLSLTSAQESTSWEGRVEDRPDGWAAYVAGVVAVLRADGYAVPGFDGADRLRRPGRCRPVELGGARVRGRRRRAGPARPRPGRRPPGDPAMLADACMRAENDYVGAPTGGMDQTVAMLGRDRPRAAARLHRRRRHARPPAARRRRPRPARHRHSGQPQPHRRVVRRPAHRVRDAAAALASGSLRETDLAERRAARRPGPAPPRTTRRHRERPGARRGRALEAGDWSSLSAMLDASHASMRDDFEISCRELDLAVETARAAGRAGSPDDRRRLRRLSGRAGAGRRGRHGCRTPSPRRSPAAGSPHPAYLVATPGDAARVDDLS